MWNLSIGALDSMAMSKDFYAGAYWGDREESLDACATRLSRFLNDMKCCGDPFCTWYEKGGSRREALTKRISPDLDYLRRLLTAGSVKGSGSTGYVVGMWNGRSDTNGVIDLSVSCGSACLKYGLLNTCVIDLPHESPGFEEVVCLSVLKPLLGSLARNWQPDWAAVIPRTLRSLLPVPHGHPHHAWILYLSDKRGTVPQLPEPARSEPLAGLGTLVTVVGELFDVDNPAHVSAVQAVYGVLRRAGLLGPIRR